MCQQVEQKYHPYICKGWKHDGRVADVSEEPFEAILGGKLRKRVTKATPARNEKVTRTATELLINNILKQCPQLLYISNVTT